VSPPYRTAGGVIRRWTRMHADELAPRTGLPQGAPLRGEGGRWDGWVARAGALRQQLRVNSPLPHGGRRPGNGRRLLSQLSDW